MVKLTSYNPAKILGIDKGTIEVAKNAEAGEEVSYNITPKEGYKIDKIIIKDKKTIYLYIENDPYSKVTDKDKEHYDTTFDIYYPPDFYLRGEFSNPNEIVINGLYHHPSSAYYGRRQRGGAE